MRTFFVREDGTASFLAATGPVTDASACMSPATFNAGFVSSALDGDIFEVSGLGGTIDTGLTINKGGTFAPITVRGDADNPPTIDVSGNTTTAEAAIFSNGTDIANLIIDGPMTLEGNGGRAAFRRIENGTGSTSVKIAPTQTITVSGNNTTNSGATVHDGFSWAGNCLDQCGTLVANDCDEGTPSGGAFQAFTPHDTCDIYIENATCGTGNSIHVGEANGSKIVIENGTFAESNFVPFVVSTDGGHIEVRSGTYTNSTEARICDVRTSDGSGYLKLANMDITIDGLNGTVQETNFGGTVIFENLNLTVDTDRFRIQLDPNANWVWDGGIVTLTAVDGASFADLTPTTTGSPTNVAWRDLYFTAGTASAVRLVNATNDDGGRFIGDNLTFDGPVATAEVILVGSSSTMGFDLTNCVFNAVTATECIDVNLTGDAPTVSEMCTIRDCHFHDCTDALALADADYVFISGTEFTGSTPAESNTTGSLWGRGDDELVEFV